MAVGPRLRCLADINERVGACSMHWDRREIHTDMVGKPKGKRALGRRKRRKIITLKCILKKLDGKAWIG